LNGIERANCFALAASGTGVEIGNHRMLYPILWLKAQEVKGTRANAPTAPSAFVDIDNRNGTASNKFHMRGLLLLRYWSTVLDSKYSLFPTYHLRSSKANSIESWPCFRPTVTKF
jgi:hypothetical protein